MNDLPHPGLDCTRAWEAMPDAVHGRLVPGQAEWFARHLDACDACRRQFALERRLQRGLAAAPGNAPDAAAGLARLLARIDGPGEPAPGPLERPGRWMARALVAAVLVQAVGLGVMGAKLWSSPPVAEYRTYASDAGAVPEGAVRLVPDPAMTLADWDALLRTHRLRVVAGPNAVGGYLVVPLEGAASHDALVERLRASAGIRLAEPAAGAP